MPAHVMILGCGRSGTSIFGELFEGLDRYAYRSEPPFDEVLSADRSIPTAFKVPRESEAHPAPPGLSISIEAYRAAFPDAKIFWIVRHPLDAVCSLRVGIGKGWSHHPRPPDWQDWLSRPLLDRCAHHWSYLNGVGFAQVETTAAVVRFEDLIADPLAFAQAVCGLIGVDPSDNQTHLAGWAGRVQDTGNSAFVEAMTSRNHSRPDHERRIGRWRENLSDAEAQAVWSMVEQTASRFDYGLASGPER